MTDKVKLPSASAVAELLRHRRTIHDFRPETPPKEKLLKAIDLARWAPNHKLTEPWHFYLLGPETAQQIVELNAQLVAAEKGENAGEKKRARWSKMPGWVVLTCDISDDELRQREDYAACCCAAHNMQLYLWSEGIGVKWTTGKVTRDPRFYDIIWVSPQTERVVGMFWYGYPAHEPETRRKPVDRILVELP